MDDQDKQDEQDRHDYDRFLGFVGKLTTARSIIDVNIAAGVLLQELGEEPTDG